MESNRETATFLIDCFINAISSYPKLEHSISYDTADNDIEITIHKNIENGFDIFLRFLDAWGVTIFAEDCAVEFFITGKGKDREKDRKKIEEAIALCVGLLEPSARVKQWYRSDHVYKSHIEFLKEGRWIIGHGTRNILWFKEFFKPRRVRIFQNSFSKDK